MIVESQTNEEAQQIVESQTNKETQQIVESQNDRTHTQEPQLALSFAVESMSNMRGRLGRHQMNIFKCILNDLNKRNIVMNSLTDLTELQLTALNRNLWRQLYYFQ